MDIGEIQKLVDKDGIVFLSYSGFLSQTLITGMTEALEKEAMHNDINMGISNNIFTIFIELSQNIMNYSKDMGDGNNQISKGLILVSKDKNGNYNIHSQNIVSLEDKKKIESKLVEIQSLDKDSIRKRYRELRRSGKDGHERGGGIGFYEVAKRCNSLEYNFRQIGNDRYYFYLKALIILKKESK